MSALSSLISEMKFSGASVLASIRGSFHKVEFNKVRTPKKLCFVSYKRK